MAYFSYNQTTSELLQISDYDIPVVDNVCVSSHPLPKIALETEYQWDKESKDFVIKSSNKLTKLEFLRRFYAQERIAIRAMSATDPIIFDAMELLNMAEFIDVNDIDTQMLIGYMVQVGLLDVSRVSEVLA
jgi:hypothetical protein